MEMKFGWKKELSYILIFQYGNSWTFVRISRRIVFQTRKCSYTELNNKWSYLWQYTALARKELNKVLVMIHVYVATFVLNGRTNGRTKSWSQYLYVSSTITPWTAIMLRSRELPVSRYWKSTGHVSNKVKCWFMRRLFLSYDPQPVPRALSAYTLRNAKQAFRFKATVICCLQMLL